MPIVLKSESLNLLKPSGPVQACNGIALPLPFTLRWSSTSALGITAAFHEEVFGLRQEDFKNVTVIFAMLYRPLLLIYN